MKNRKADNWNKGHKKIHARISERVLTIGVQSSLYQCEVTDVKAIETRKCGAYWSMDPPSPGVFGRTELKAKCKVT